MESLVSVVRQFLEVFEDLLNATACVLDGCRRGAGEPVDDEEGVAGAGDGFGVTVNAAMDVTGMTGEDAVGKAEKTGEVADGGADAGAALVGGVARGT